MTGRDSLVQPLSQLTPAELANADPRYPKWATMCLLRMLGLPVLEAVLLTPGQDQSAITAAIETMAGATGARNLMVRSDGGIETGRYYRGGNTFPIDQIPGKAATLIAAGRAVLLLEPTNRFINLLAAVLRMDRPAPGQHGTLTIEALGPGYDVADLTRGGIRPQITITAVANWSCYTEPWWADLRLTSHAEAEDERRNRRLVQLATYVLADVGHLDTAPKTPDQQAATAEKWLREHGFDHLWRSQDIAAVVARYARRWYEEAFLIGAYHPNRNWTCLATATSDIGGRRIFWDVVDGARKYATAVVRRTACVTTITRSISTTRPQPP